AVLTSALAVRALGDLIAADEERIQRALKGGKRVKPVRTSDGRLLREAHEEAAACLERMRLLRSDEERSRSQRRAEECAAEVAECEARRAAPLAAVARP